MDSHKFGLAKEEKEIESKSDMEGKPYPFKF